MLRAGGYFVWAAQPVYKHEENLQDQWRGTSVRQSYFLLFLVSDLDLYTILYVTSKNYLGSTKMLPYELSKQFTQSITLLIFSFSKWLTNLLCIVLIFILRTEMENLTGRICWELVKKEEYIAIWRKPLNNSCYLSRDTSAQPPVCDIGDDPDNVWYFQLYHF